MEEEIPVISLEETKPKSMSLTKKDIPGLEAFDAEELMIPYIRLIQGASKVDHGNPGQFINSSTGKVQDIHNIVFVCFSKDMVAFKDPKTQVPGEPQRRYKLLGIDIDNRYPIILAVTSGSSIGAIKVMLNSFYQEGIPLYERVVKMYSEKKIGQFGAYYALRFEIGGTPSEEVILTAGQLLQSASSIFGKKAEGTTGTEEPEEMVV